MSLFVCPNSSRILLRSALRSVASKASATPQPFAPTRWISGCASRNRQGLSSTVRCRNAAFVTRHPSYETRRTLFSDKTIQKYEDLPKGYRDQQGLPFRSFDLMDSEVLQVFGRGINPKRANHLLRILHGRRVAGTLDDPAFAIHTASFTKDQIAKGLAYLRKSIPVDEVMNAGLRAEDELMQMERDEEAAENEKNAKQAAKKEEVETAAYKPDPVYGHSKFDEIRARNIAERKAREAAEEEERLAAEARGEAGPLAQVGEKAERQISNPRIAEYHQKAQSDLEAPPELKTWERILPSATAVALVVGFLAAVAAVYEEPDARYRLFPDVSTAHATVAAIIGLNVLIWAGWKAPPLWSLFNRYMLFVVATVKPVTMFTAPFSHQKLSHLLINMVPLFFVGGAIHDEIGRANFLALFVSCGALGFLGGLVTYTLRGWLTVTSLGASGATLGLCSAFFWEHRNDGFKIFGLPQDGVHGIVFLALLFVPQLAAFGKTVTLKVDLASHLVGMLAGILGIEYINRAEKSRDKMVIDVPSDEVMVALGRLPQERDAAR
ncbi:rhomboid [Fusarium albosuccineum]|uniref:Rhomboid n=1 Tax=Fusarium albosuccineum TaxID=1237068 RepID=A0A8H4LKP8_9HYPO|nr:rhomboid [Fusarium albosuccineum]